MKLELKLMSEKILKPSSPTPDHLRHFNLSFLDQLCPPVYYPLVYFYRAHGGTRFSFNSENLKQLEESLSEVLTCFYPLAGRLRDNMFVDCDDGGIPYLQARVKCNLSRFLEESMPSELNKLLPFDLGGAHKFLLGVQLNIFECGGIGIAVCVSHKIADASSFFTFIKSWAAANRSDEPKKLQPEFVSPALFPATNVLGYNPSSNIVKQKTVAKSFFFSNSSIEALMAKYYKNSTDFDENQPQPQPHPSPVEALSAFAWSRIVASTEEEPAGTATRFYQLVHVVDLRSRMKPPLAEGTFGNMQWVAATLVPHTSAGEQLSVVVKQVRESINRIDNGYMKAFQEGDIFSAFVEENDRICNGATRFTFAGFCEFAMYEVDFGWGKPVWVGLPTVPFNNQIAFTDTASGEGIELKVQLKEEDMAKFQEDRELLEFVTPT